MNPLTPTVRTRSTTITEQVYNLTGADIVGLLIERGDLLESQRGAEVTFTVPGGGDWSNSTIDVDADNPVVVTIRDRKETNTP